MPKYVIERSIPGAGTLSLAVYIADDPETVREHAAAGGFPADAVSEVRSVVDPAVGGA